MADPVALARRVLEDCGYPDACRRRGRLDLEALLKGYGLQWDRRPFKLLGGALVLFDAEYYVVTNSRFSRARQRSAAAHELGHYLMHRGRPPRVFLPFDGPQDGCCGEEEGREREREADAFARELLGVGEDADPLGVVQR